MGYIRGSRDASMEFLVHAQEFLASSLSYSKTLRNVAHVSVPFLGDWCVIDLFDPLEDVTRRVAVVHSDPAKAKFAREIERFPYRDRKGLKIGPRHVIETRQSEVYSDVKEEELVYAYPDPERRKIYKSLGLISAIIVPMDARNQTLGTLTFVSGSEDRRFDSSDLPVAEQLGRLAALHIDNSRLHTQLQRDLQLRDHVLSVISHDLNNPLSAVKLAIELILRSNHLNAPGLAEPLDSDRNLRLLKNISSASDHMADLISDILSLRESNASVTLTKSEENVTELIERSIHLLSALASKRKVKLNFERMNWDEVAFIDPEQIQLVVTLLLENTIFSLLPDSTVSLKIYPEDDASNVTIEMIARGRSVEPILLGQGVKTSEVICAAHQGKFFHEHSDEGSVFRLVLPYADGDQSAAA